MFDENFLQQDCNPTIQRQKSARSSSYMRQVTSDFLAVCTLGLLWFCFFTPEFLLPMPVMPFWRPKASSTKATAWCCPATAGVRSHGNSLRWMSLSSRGFVTYIYIYNDEKYIFKYRWIVVCQKPKKQTRYLRIGGIFLALLRNMTYLYMSFVA